MEKLNVVRDGGRKLPPGFRFQPTDEEIVFQYLSRKTFSHPLPALLIQEFDVFNFDPWELPGDPEQDMYFFCNKEDNNIGYGREMGRSTDHSGFWKATGSIKPIICSKKMPIVGIRKSFVFHRGVRTDWMMHEYYIALSGNPQTHNSQGSLIRIGNWTLCRIFLKKRNRETEVDEDEDEDEDAYSSSASSSDDCDSGCFTEVSSS